jgi:hypothetical protein
MKTSEMSIRQKLFEIQQEIKVPKDEVNDFAGFNYRSCEGILKKLKPLMKKHNVMVTLSDEITEKASFPYCTSTATMWDLDSPDVISVTSNAREAFEKKGMDMSQISGSTSSYSRKYALNGLLCIDDGIDADSSAIQREVTTPPSGDKSQGKKYNVSKADPIL